MTPPVLAPNKKAAPEDGFLTKGLPLLLFGFLSLADRLLKELVVPFDDLAEFVGGEVVGGHVDLGELGLHVGIAESFLDQALEAFDAGVLSGATMPYTESNTKPSPNISLNVGASG